MEYEYTPRSEIISRTERFQQALQENNIDSALISQNADLFYFTGTIQPSHLYIPAQGEPVHVVHGDVDRTTKESGISRLIPLKKRSDLGKILADAGYSLKGRIGLELDVLPAKRYLSLCREFPDAGFVDVSDLIRTVRMIKSDYEVSHYRKAYKIMDKVMEKARKEIRPGMTELEVDALLSGFSRAHGHQGLIRMRGYNQDMFNAHIYCGKTGAAPSFLVAPLGGQGTTPAIAQGGGFNKITENTPILIDFGVAMNGYTTDVTRTFVIGELSPELQKAYTFAREIKLFMEGWVKPGKYCDELYDEVIRHVREAGYQDNFEGYKDNQVQFVGHGIGLEVDEYPLIAAGFHRAFQPNMVFAFEPKLVFPGIGAVGVEDDYLVTETGLERISTYDDNLLHIVRE
jgi:Xaa-Pro dipeptidase